MSFSLYSIVCSWDSHFAARYSHIEYDGTAINSMKEEQQHRLRDQLEAKTFRETR